MAGRIGWRFPPTSGGRADGFNDPGMAHFGGNPLDSLARETIQNSLDARASDSAPVRMSFGIEVVDRSEALGRAELAAAIRACVDELRDTGGDDDKARSVFSNALGLLERPKLTYLRIADQNTTGLHHEHWRALVKLQGASVKARRDAGGSHGIGKYAPFGVSPLRTVFYWTRFHEGTTRSELFQGKAVLMSHKDVTNGAETQGTGFYGHVDGCQALLASDIPPRIRQVEHRRDRGQGTSLWVAGFETPEGWQRRVATSVVADFFYAIEGGTLSVEIEPTAELRARRLYGISQSTIVRWFDYLAPEQPGATDEEDAVAEAYQFWAISRADEPVAEKEDKDLGHCRLWVRVADGLPKKVGFVRATGMLITTRQYGLLRFRGLQDFIALCVFDAPKGNALLRDMENPQHNQFEPDRLADDQQRRVGRAALKRITSWIRQEIRKHAAPPLSAATTDLSELAEYLPDLEPDEDLDSPKSDGEPAFGGPNVIRLKQRRLPPSRATPSDDDDNADDGDGTDTASLGGGGDGQNDGDDGTGTGDGDGTDDGGHGDRGGSRGHESVAIADVRMVPIPGVENRYKLSFVPGSTGPARVELGEAGDSSAIERRDITAFDSEGAPLDLHHIELSAGKRTAFEVTGVEPLAGRAWRVRAVKRQNPS